MSPIDYLRGVVRREPAALPPAPSTAPAPQLPRDLSWENASRRIAATCNCDPTLYSRCYCHLRKQAVQ